MESDPKPGLVLITGASGFIGANCVKLFLHHDYRVRATVRNAKNPKKTEFLKELVPEKAQNLEIAEADLMKKETWGKAVEGCEYVIHVASPVPLEQPKNEMEVITPAVEGVKNVLEAAIEKGVKKFVLTSSVSAIWPGNYGRPVTENDWCIEKFCSAYDKSKRRSEKAAWEIWNKNPGKIELSVINPGFVLGTLQSLQGGAIEEAFKMIMTNKYPGIPKLSVCCVDVRDVALAHLRALENPQSNGKRYILAGKSFWMKELIEILKEEYSRYGYKFPKNEIPKWIMQIGSIFDKRAGSVLPFYDKVMRVDNSLSKAELGIEYINPTESVLDLAQSLIRLGAVPNKLNV